MKCSVQRSLTAGVTLALLSAEPRLDGLRGAARQPGPQSTPWVAVGASALAVLIVLLTLAVLWRRWRHRQRAEAALARESDLLQVLMDHIPDTIYFKDRDSRFTRINRAQARVLGVAEPAAASGKTDFDFQREDVSRLSFTREQEIMASGQPLIDWIEFVPTLEGAPRWFSSTKIPIRDKAGRITGLVGISRDVTAHQQAQAALEAANKELEAFSYSVSHDLRTPLRAIDGFSQILLEDYAGQLDAPGQDYLRRVRGASHKMAELIDALLSLARLTRAELRRQPVDLSALAREVLADLQSRDPGRQVETVIASGLTALGDPRLLQAALENLLGNAWKFTARTPNARIEMGCLADAPAAPPPEAAQAPQAGQTAFFVRDNGAGFDMAHADRLFGAFQRLHGQADYGGTGIGLATVQRIVHRHGGEVWAQADTDHGATFYFTLPAA